MFFLAAGLGTRLRPLTDRLPKALVPVGNEPQLFRLAARFPDSRLVANAHHLADRLQATVRDWEGQTGGRLALSHEREVLGTAGGLRAARSGFADGAVLVHNADIDVPVEAYTGLADADPEALATLLVSDVRAVGEGNVGLDAERRVVRLRQTRTGAREAASCDYLGIALLAPTLLDALPQVGCLVGDVWIPALLAGARLRVSHPAASRVASAGFFDLGTPRSYLEANMAWLHAQGLRLRAEPSAIVHAECIDVVAAAGTRLQARCERVVAWQGAQCSAPLHDAIVTADGIVALGELDQSAR